MNTFSGQRNKIKLKTPKIFPFIFDFLLQYRPHPCPSPSGAGSSVAGLMLSPTKKATLRGGSSTVHSTLFTFHSSLLTHHLPASGRLFLYCLNHQAIGTTPYSHKRCHPERSRGIPYYAEGRISEGSQWLKFVEVGFGAPGERASGSFSAENGRQPRATNRKGVSSTVWSHDL